MELIDKLEWLGLGAFLGFILGYIVRSLHDIKEKVDHVDEEVTHSQDTSKWDQNDSGSAKLLSVPGVALAMVILITAWAAFSTARVNSELQYTLSCITNYNTHQSKALGKRDDAINKGTNSEIHLWTKYGKLYAIAKADPSKIPEVQEQLRKAIDAHRQSLAKLQETRDVYPYANPDVLANCEKENHK